MRNESLKILAQRSITSDTSFKLLGIYIDNNLKWKTNIDFLCSKDFRNKKFEIIVHFCKLYTNATCLFLIHI